MLFNRISIANINIMAHHSSLCRGLREQMNIFQYQTLLLRNLLDWQVMKFLKLDSTAEFLSITPVSLKEPDST